MPVQVAGCADCEECQKTTAGACSYHATVFALDENTKIYGGSDPWRTCFCAADFVMHFGCNDPRLEAVEKLFAQDGIMSICVSTLKR